MRKILVLSAVALAMAAPAHADGFMSTLGKSWSCVKESAKSAAKISVDVVGKAAKVAEIGANAAACTAVQGGNSAPFVATLGALSAIKLASPSSIPTGQCKSAVKGVVAKPFAEGLSVIMPASDVRTKLISLTQSELAKQQLWDAITGIPGIQPYTMQVDCACTTIDGGISLTDVEAIADAVNQTSDACASALDALGLGFINDLDDKAAELAEDAYAGLSGAYDEFIRGESDPDPHEVVYQREFGRNRNFYALKVGMSPDNTNIMSELENAIEGCALYYDDHKHAYSTGRKICTSMAQRLEADARTLGLKFSAERRMLEHVQKEWPARFVAHWGWRTPPAKKPGFPVDEDLGPAFLNERMPDNSTNPNYVALQKLGGQLTCAKGEEKRQWLCPGTGIFASARQMFVMVKDHGQVLSGAEAGMAAVLRDELTKQWDANRSFATNWYLHTWYKQPPMGGVFGCPANNPLAQACKDDLRKSFDIVCFGMIRDAVVQANINSVKANNPAAKAITTCQSILQPRITLANALSQKSVGMNPGAAEAQLCATYGARTPQKESCQRIVSQAYDKCALDAVKAGPTFSGNSQGPFLACWDKARADLKGSMATQILVLHPPTVTTPPAPKGPVTAPSPGTLKVKPQ